MVTLSCSATATVTVVEVTIAPATITAIEGLDSASYTATLSIAGATAYDWDWEAPAGAGNNPNVNFSAPTAQTTNVIRAHWFADPNDRHWLVTGDDCSYDIKCDVTHPDGICTGDAVFNVDANPTGATSIPQFTGWGTIVIATRIVGPNTEWYVNGQGGFTRTAPVKTLNCVSTSQFYAKVDAHESKHVTQLTAELPWMDLFHANNLYSNTLVSLTSLVSEADLRAQISAAVTAQHNADAATVQSTLCALEIAAFAVDTAIAPHYCEVDATEVPGLYGCTP